MRLITLLLLISFSVNTYARPEKKWLRSPMAAFVGSVKWVYTANCSWVQNTTSWADMPLDTDCDDNLRVVKGEKNITSPDIGHADGRKPQIKLRGLPAGHYEIIARGVLYRTTSNTVCNWRFNDGTNTTVMNTTYASTGASSVSHASVTGSIYYAKPQEEVTITLQARHNTGTGCLVSYILSDDDLIEIAVYFYPDLADSEYIITR